MQPVSPHSESPDSRTVSRARTTGRARQRHMARKARQQGGREANRPTLSRSDGFTLESLTRFANQAAYAVRAALQDFSWDFSPRQIVLIAAGLVGLVVLFSMTSMLASGNVLPRVSVGGVGIGGLGEADAIARLNDAWTEHRLTLREGERTWTVTPAELGFRLDAVTTVQQALARGRESGLGSGVSLLLSGADVPPVVEVDVDQARQRLLSLAREVNIPAQNATVQLQGVVVTEMEPEDGRRLNLAELLPALTVDPAGWVQRGVIDLPMLAVHPTVTDASPLVEYAQSLLHWPLTLEAYDPVTDTTYPFVIPPQEWGQWLSTRLSRHATGLRLYLSVSRTAVRDYLDEESTQLPEPLRLDVNEGISAVQDAVANGTMTGTVNVRYNATVYTVQRGDRAYSIARDAGLPYYLLLQANPDRNLDELYPGDQINLPSRDVMLPLPPVRNKRIVVDLSDQHLVAYESGEVVFDWLVSTGMDSAPTSPGVFQILSHTERAYGSSYTLCEDDSHSCGQWVMHWFMGIYEAVPGLMNGFHGAVELPDGRYLGGGNVGRPYTFGCIMSLEDNAIALYNWAEPGVIVEIRE
jgi:LysM repeat protein